MPFVAGGAPGSSREPGGPPPTDPPKSPRTPSPLQKRKSKKLSNLRTSFSGPRLAIFMAYSPKRLPRRPHGEANGLMKPPSAIRKRIWIYFL